MVDIAKLIKNGRLRKKISQAELSQKLGVVPSAISQWESGKKIPSGDTLLKLAVLLEIVQELFPEYKIEEIKKDNQEEKKYVTMDEFHKEMEELKKSIVIYQNSNHRSDNHTITNNSVGNNNKIKQEVSV